MADMLNFKKGLRAALPSTKVAGTIYVTTDERAMYIDISNTERIRLGDFVECASMTALEGLGHYSTTALYCVKDGNDYKLLKYINTTDGKHNFAHLNSTANVAQAVTDLGTRVSANETAITALNTTIGIQPDESKYDDGLSVWAALEAEATKRAADDSALGTRITNEASTRENADNALSGRIDGHDTRIEALETASATHATKTELNTEKTNRENADNALGLRIDGVVGRVEDLEDVVGGSGSGLVKDVADLKADKLEKDTAISNINGEINGIKTRLTDAETNIGTVTQTANKNKTDLEALTRQHNTLAGTVGEHTTQLANQVTKNSEIDTAIAGINTELAKKATNAALESLSGTVATNKKNAEDAIALVDEKANTNAGEITKLKTADTQMSERVGGIETEITTVKNTYATKTELAGEVSTLNTAIGKKADQTALNALSKTVTDNKTETDKAIEDVDKKVGENATAISNLQTRAKAIEDDVSGFKKTVSETYVTLSAYNTKMQALDKKDSDHDSAISGLQSTTENHETRIGNLETASATHATKTYVDELHGQQKTYIDNAFKAADAMKFMGETASLAALKQKAAADCEAGHTYVLTADDGAANATVGDLFICQNDGDNQNWIHVKSGYVSDHEATMSVASNKISLKSYTGANLGEVTLAAAANTAVRVSTSGSTVTVGMEWGSF